MNKATTDYHFRLEQLLYKDESLRQYLIYTYYDKNEEPLYVGCSKSFYDAHYFNSERLPFFKDVVYVGFFFLDNEEDMKDARKYFIRAREPKFNQRKCKSTELLPGLDPSADSLVITVEAMEALWEHLLGEEERDPIEAAEDLAIDTMVKSLREKEDPDGLLAAAAAMILDLRDQLRFNQAVIEYSE